MTKEQIKELFRKTRPSRILFPYDLNNFSQEIINHQIDKEQDHLSNIRIAIENYARKLINKDEPDDKPKSKLTLNIERNADIVGDLPYKSFFGGNESFIYYNTHSFFEKRLAIAEALGLFVLRYMPLMYRIKCGFNPSESQNECIYFAQRLLEIYASLNNGSILRNGITPNAVEVYSEIKRLNLRPNYIEKPLSEERKKHINNIIDKIFIDNPVAEISPLSCEKQIIKDYITRKERLTSEKKERYNVEIEPALGFYNPRGRIYGSYNKETFDAGCYILHTPVGYLKTIQNIKEKAQSVARLLVAHEIGHAICHYKYGDVFSYTDEKLRESELEREASYYAFLLLKHREFLYHGRDDEKYKIACEEWESLFRLVYNNHIVSGKKWVESVLNDDEWEDTQ
jgi:Zn-dependent peptidase ImmA (M78 family)